MIQGRTQSKPYSSGK